MDLLNGGTTTVTGMFFTDAIKDENQRLMLTNILNNTVKWSPLTQQKWNLALNELQSFPKALLSSTQSSLQQLKIKRTVKQN